MNSLWSVGEEYNIYFQLRRKKPGKGMNSATRSSLSKSRDNFDRRYFQPKQKSVRFSQYDEVSVIESNRKTKHTRRCVSFMNKVCSFEKLIESLSVIAIIKNYRLKDIIPDLIAGLTISVMHIPQGMAYMALADIPVEVGLYMGVFPSVIYFLFGSSRHISIGSFAVVSLMTGSIIEGFSKDTPYSNIQIASSIATVVGLWHLGLCLCRFGFFCSILSKTMVNAFTAGASLHVLISQLSEFFGIKSKVETHHGLFNLIQKGIDISKNIPETNVATFVVSLTTCGVLILNLFLIKPIITSRCKVGGGLPIELIVMILGTLISYCVNFSVKYDIDIVGELPQGFPVPTVPILDVMWDVKFESLVLTLASYAIAMSVAFQLASNCNYVVDPQQELLALGLSNIFASFFSCIPVGVSLTRSVIQKDSGGHTQVASLISSVFIIITIFYVSPLLKALPKCVLASIIIVSLKKMLFQIIEFPGIWKISSVDGILWLITFLSVIILDVTYGIGIGVLFALISIYYHSMTPYICLLGKINLESTTKDGQNEMYIDMIHLQASEVPGIRIIQISTTLHFANKAYVIKMIQELAGVSPREVLKVKKKLKKKSENQELIDEQIDMMMTVNFRVSPANFSSSSTSEAYLKTKKKLTHIIVDLSLVMELDQSTINSLVLLVEQYQQINVTMIIVSNSPAIDGKIPVGTVHSVRAAVRSTSL